MSFPKIAEMRQKTLEVCAKQDEAERIEKCRRMSETMDIMRRDISLAIEKTANKGYYKTSVDFHKDFFDLEKSTILFCLKKVAEELHAEGYTVKLDTNCKITVSWKWEEE